MSESLCLACANFDICKYAEQVVSNQEKMEDIISKNIDDKFPMKIRIECTARRVVSNYSSRISERNI